MKFKKHVSFFISFLILFSSCISFAEEEYATRGEVVQMLLNAADEYNSEVVKEDIIKGYEDGLLHEERFVTRAEALIMLKRAFGEFATPVGHNKRVALKAEDFTDIPSWAQDELETVFNCGIAAGKAEGLFAPGDYVTKEQMELFIRRIFSLQAENEKDDFYATVNKSKLEEMELIPGNPAYSVMQEMSYTAAEDLRGIIDDAISHSNPDGTPEQKIVDLYRCVIDTESRNKAGITPIKDYIEKIDSAKTVGELAVVHSLIAKELFVFPLMSFNLTYDLYDGEGFRLYFSPYEPFADRDTYTEGNNKEAYINYLEKNFVLLGDDEITAKSNAIELFEFETVLASSMLLPEESSNIENAYNVSSFNKVSSMFPDFDMDELIKSCGLEKEEKVIIGDLGGAEKFAELYNQNELAPLKLAMKMGLVSKYGNTLNEDFTKAEIEYSAIVTGIEPEYIVEDIVIGILEEVMGDYLAKLYTEKYFDAEMEKDVLKMTKDIIGVFKTRIDSLTWMSEETKTKAKEKLDKIDIKIGAPDTFSLYLESTLILPPKRGGTFFNNILKINKASVDYMKALQKTGPGKSMWLMQPYTVNAAYNLSENDITLPVAILQKPMYDKNASYEANLGGIGFIIAHEITHAFDSNGALFDVDGNIKNWWSENDFEVYSGLCNEVKEMYDNKELIPGVVNNGTLTLNENIADLGALACITQIVDDKKLNHKELYQSFASAWASTATREMYALLSNYDVHSADKLRVNITLMNSPKFYEVYGIDENDGMYIPEENRVGIW